MREKELQGLTALVTGASGGLGADFAISLARRGCNLILVARTQVALEELQKKVTADWGVQAAIIVMDLSIPDSPEQLYQQILSKGLQVDILINNAGFGLYGLFIDQPWDRLSNLLELDITTPVHLTKLVLKDMLVRKRGYILLISSIGAYQPSPTYAIYSAAKRFILDFGEALSYELRNTGVKCTVLSPGITATNFLKVSGQKATLYQRLLMMKSPDVVEIGIKAMLRGRPSVVAGWLNKLSAQSMRIMPRRLAAAITNIFMTK